MANKNLRKKGNLTSSTPSTLNKRIENSWILLLRNDLFENDNFTIVTLPHPAHGTPAKYCLDVKHNKIYEIVLFNESYRSWFINETVKSDGGMQILTPMNPLFLVLPRLKNLCSDKAMPLEDLLSEKGFDKIIDFIHNLENIGDPKGSPDLKAYKYNEEKTMTWLEDRVRKLAKVLREKNIHVTSGVASATFVVSNINNADISEEFYLKYANGIISEYLEEELAENFEKRFNFKPDLIESVGMKRKSDTDQTISNKKIKMDSNDIEGIENISQSNQNIVDMKKPKPLTAKEKARQKAASKTKTISSFFTKK